MRLPGDGSTTVRRWRRVGLIVLLGCLIVSGCSVFGNANKVKTAVPPLPQGHQGSRPNIVFILTDDLSWNLVKYIPQVRQMQREGMTFTNATVTDSLCCPSRASIFTGDFPHDTHIFKNVGYDGGFDAFFRHGEDAHSYAIDLQRHGGYRTAMYGKYLNGYQPTSTMGGRHDYVPPGWSSWNAVGSGYHEFDYAMATDGRSKYYGSHPSDYLTTVMGDRAVPFIRQSVRDHTPFAMELATFTPHYPYVPAPRDRHLYPHLKAPHTRAWNRIPKHAPTWLTLIPPIGPIAARHIDGAFRKRVQDMASVSRMIARVRSAVAAAGATKNTYFVFSSDNGYHMGEYRMRAGKMTAFDTDVRVPIVVVGPGVPKGVTNPAVVQNIDFAPTFDQIAGVPVPGRVDGHSMLGLWHGDSVRHWRNLALIEHHGPNLVPYDPDWQSFRSGNPPSYEAIRSPTFTSCSISTERTSTTTTPRIPSSSTTRGTRCRGSASETSNARWRGWRTATPASPAGAPGISHRGDDRLISGVCGSISIPIRLRPTELIPQRRSSGQRRAPASTSSPSAITIRLPGGRPHCRRPTRQQPGSSGAGGITVVPGMELSTKLDGVGVHLLAYFLDPAEPSLVAELDRVLGGRASRPDGSHRPPQRRRPRSHRARRPRAGGGGTRVGRPHIADVLVARGYAADRQRHSTSTSRTGVPATWSATRLRWRGCSRSSLRRTGSR